MAKLLFKSSSFKLGCNMTTKVQPELISDADMHLLFEKVMRGRVSLISNKN